MEFATGALGTLLPKLSQLAQDEYNLHKGSKKNIEFLKRELESIQAALRNVGEVPLDQLSELVKIWARDARELSYDMEDIVDTFLVRVQQGPHPPSKRSSKRFIKKMKDFVGGAKIQHEIGREIKDIRERVKDLAERRDRYIHAIAPAKTLVDPRIRSLYTKAANLVGINEASEEVITMLTKGDATSSQQKIVSIVGFGGLGKTTLAKVVHDKLNGKFGCMAFVPVGRNPDLKKVFKDIIIYLDKQGYMNLGLEMLDETMLINKIQGFLENKRYFIVIDDVWETQTWQIIKLALVENSSENRIIITTRNHEVGREAGEVYKLQPLSDDNSRKLFFARIFGGEIKSSDHHPDEVSDKILRKCGGIPLAIMTMASLLVGKRREEWIEVHRSIGFGNKENQQVENTMKIVSFSYYDLPPHLRTWLLYLSVFPEDYFIEKGSLIWMWIAEGFVKEKKGVSLFEIGEGYFNELVNRSMIQLEEKWVRGMQVCGCQVHDMVLDLICGISSEENFVTISSGKNNEEESSSTHGRVRRLALQNINNNNNNNNSRTMEEAHMDLKQVRSIISFGCYTYSGVPLSTFKLVRVLSIDASQPMECLCLEHLQKLLHLRYLWLSGILMVPEEIVGPNVRRVPLSRHTVKRSFAVCNRRHTATMFPSFCINSSCLPNLSQLYLCVGCFDDHDLRILGGLPELCEINLFVLSRKEVVCNTATNTADAAGDDCFFPKLRRFIIRFSSLEVLPKGDTGGVSFIMYDVNALCCWGKAGVAPTLMLSIQQLDFSVYATQLIKDGDNHGDCFSLVMQHFASLQNLSVRMFMRTSVDEEVVEAVLQQAADVHANRPTLKITWM